MTRATDFTFVCLNCFQQLKITAMRCRYSSGTTYCACCTRCPTCNDCGTMMRQIDDNIIDIIISLNKKGYKTMSSCGGKDWNSIYITISGKYKFKRWPSGFKVETNRIDGATTFTIIDRSFNDKMTPEDCRKDVAFHINVLREWVNAIATLRNLNGEVA